VKAGWTDDLLCFLNTLLGGSPGVGPGCLGEFVGCRGTSPSPLRLSTVSLLLGSVRLRRTLPPTDCTGLPGASATGESSSLVIPSVRAPRAREAGDGLRFSYKRAVTNLLPCLSVVLLLLAILVGWGFRRASSFHHSPPHPKTRLGPVLHQPPPFPCSWQGVEQCRA